MTHIAGDWLASHQTQAVFAALSAEGDTVFCVGGCVRNALIGHPVNDIDMATSARPKDVMRLARAAGFHAIPTGIDHGTVTVVAEDTPYEVTTFRRDVATDGRRAVVAFADQYEEDAHRRDFTINALYADASGLVYDPVGGIADIEKGRLRFIDDASARIREDYLRTLRYFRFFAWYGDPESGFDSDALADIAANLDGLASLSRERVTTETLKLLAAPDPAMALAGMERTGVAMALYGAGDLAAFQRYMHWAALLELEGDTLARLCVFMGLHGIERLRLSRSEMRETGQLLGAVESSDNTATLAYRHGAERALQMEVLRAAILENAPAANAQKDAERGAAAIYPIQARDLMPKFEGAALGKELARLEQIWVASDFTLTRDELLNQ